MKKIVILAVVTVIMSASSVIVPKMFENSLSKAEVAVMSNIVYTECVNASGEVDKNEQGFIVLAAVSEVDISCIKIGQKAVISGKGFGGSEYTGTVETIADTACKQQSDSGQKTVIDVQILVNNPDENIRKGNTADIKIMTADEREITLVPYEAVNQDDDGTEYVYVFSDGVALRKNITTGLELSEGIEVLSGINENDQVLKSDDEIKNGNFVKVVK